LCCISTDANAYPSFPREAQCPGKGIFHLRQLDVDVPGRNVHENGLQPVLFFHDHLTGFLFAPSVWIIVQRKTDPAAWQQKPLGTMNSVTTGKICWDK
jgi:hypothetical protein